MGPNISLRDATIQDIQLELIRRSRFNAFDGERIHASLLRHRDLWTAALLDRPGHSLPYGSLLLLTGGLIKLRDLPDNIWNTDTLYVLTPSPETARELGRRIEAEAWGGEVIVYEDSAEIDPTIGSSDGGFGLLTVWWD